MTDPYPVLQIDSLVRLLQKLRGELPNLEWIAGHESLDTSQIQASDNPELFVRRKRDPGPLFPWDQLLRALDLERLTTD